MYDTMTYIHFVRPVWHRNSLEYGIFNIKHMMLL